MTRTTGLLKQPNESIRTTALLPVSTSRLAELRWQNFPLALTAARTALSAVQNTKDETGYHLDDDDDDDMESNWMRSPGASRTRRSLFSVLAVTGSAVWVASAAQWTVSSHPVRAASEEDGDAALDALDQFAADLEKNSGGIASPPSPPSTSKKSRSGCGGSSNKWPDSPSPLPTNTRSAQELSSSSSAAVAAEPPSIDYVSEDTGSGSDLDQAIKASKSKRSVNPLTDGF